VHQLVPRRLVPVGVEAQDADPVRDVPRDGVLDLAAVVVDPVGRVVRLPHRLLDVLQRGVRPDARAAGAGREHLGGAAAVVPAVVLARLAHPLEGVVEVQVAAGVTGLGERSGRREHAAAAPDTALDDVAGDAVADDVTHRVDQGVELLGGGHGVRLDRADRGLDRIVVVVREFLLGLGSGLRCGLRLGSRRPGRGTRLLTAGSRPLLHTAQLVASDRSQHVIDCPTHRHSWRL
jgi:hypothetical protein